MSRADYAHWNEDADYMWWQEEGRHVEEAPDPDDFYDGDDFDGCDECGEAIDHYGDCGCDDSDLGWDDDDGLTDVEADAMTLRDAGWGTDEDYGYPEDLGWDGGFED